jgi:riboflavin synthase
MFTGIVEEIGTVKSVSRKSHSSTMVISADKVLTEMKVGDSINTNGVCLTVTSFTKNSFSVDIMPETFLRSGLSKLGTGDKVNMERALRLTDRLGGHIVNGHVDGTGKITRIWKEENAVWFNITADEGVLKYIVEKGSVALEGISLTVAHVDEHSFDVSIIPHTAQVTTLPGKHPGDSINIECDIVGKYVERLVSGEKKETIGLDFLGRMGF